ncbi:MAG: transposase [Spirochaetaceae bacterium]|nr:transposase [Spirochaetaceae bacterium]
MGEQRRTYPAELKRDALEMLKTLGKSAAVVARDRGIDSGLLKRWRRAEAQEANGKKAFPGQGIPRDEELVKLRKEVVDWFMRTGMTATIVIAAFMMAVARRKPKGRLVFHSNRGISALFE